MPQYLQLCGLGGNFSLEMSWRDMMLMYAVTDVLKLKVSEAVQGQEAR